MQITNSCPAEGIIELPDASTSIKVAVIMKTTNAGPFDVIAVWKSLSKEAITHMIIS